PVPTSALSPIERSLEGRSSRVRYVDSRSYAIAANWKVVVDNYLDGGYHVPHMHKSLAASLDMASYTTKTYERCSIQAAGGQGDATRIGAGAAYAWIYPTFMINAYGGCIDTNTILPLGPDRCLVHYDFFFAPEAADVEASIAESDVVQRE